MRAGEQPAGLPGINTQWLGRHLIVLDQVASTNTWLKQYGNDLPDGTTVLALRQTNGRGRMGRQWHDEPGAGLAMSVLLKHSWTNQITLLPLLAGVCVCEALTELGRSSLFSIKWSNDVLWNERKICGILCETRTMGNNSFSVIGIGVNLLHSQAAFSQHDLVYATSMFLATQKKFTAEETAGKICSKLEYYLDLCAKNGIGIVLDLYRRYCISTGRQIQALTPDGIIRGTALEIADDGALICRTEHGQVIHFRTGEVSIRGMNGYI